LRAKIERSLMRRPSACAARAPNSTARQFKTGKAPGKPRHTGQVFEFGSSPKRVEHPQKIFDSVLNCAWTSSPMIVSQELLSGFMFQVSGFAGRPANLQSKIDREAGLSQLET